MHIVLSSDNNYAPLLGVTVFSILENNKKFQNNKALEKIHIYIMDMNISEKNKKYIDEIIHKQHAIVHYLDTRDIHSYLEENIKLDVRSLATYYRLFLPSLLPDTVEKVIYMDCDSLIDDSLEDLWNTDMNGYDIAGVLDLISVENKLCVGLREDDPYVNAGMLLINLAKWRNDHMEKQMIDFILKHDGKVCYHDQGTINGVCLSKKILPPKYNAMTPFFVMKLTQLKHYHALKEYYSKEELKEAKENPVFIHFTPYLTDRPWVKGNLHPLRAYYNTIMNKTPWKGTRFNKPSKTLEPWVKWMFYLLPYSLFITILRALQKFKPKTWIKSIFIQKKEK